jgi:ferrochelatase
MGFKEGKIYPSNEGRTGVLLTNLGTPQAPTTKALRRYLSEFLSDPRVVEIPRVLWMIILHGIILRVRPKKSAHAYETVWTERGSPLKFHTEDQVSALQKVLNSGEKSEILIDYAMRYGEPSIASRLEKMAEQKCDKLLVLPLYPQYASATGGSTFDAISKELQTNRKLPNLRFVANYHTYPPYIEALVASIRAHWDKHGQAEKLLLSYHGLPKFSHDKGDPYYTQCLETSALIAKALGLKEEQFMSVFQSRFGAAEWLQPYTDETLKSLAKDGTRFVQVICPGFSADCLETIEEIGVENRDYFLEAGGERYEYIPALNATSAHIEVLKSLIEGNLQGW